MERSRQPGAEGPAASLIHAGGSGIYQQPRELGSGMSHTCTSGWDRSPADSLTAASGDPARQRLPGVQDGCLTHRHCEL